MFFFNGIKPELVFVVEWWWITAVFVDWVLCL